MLHRETVISVRDLWMRYGEHDVLCPRCGKPNEARGDVCDICGNTVGLKLKYDVDECQERGMTYAVPL